MKILWINTSNNAISFWRLEQIAKYIFDNYRVKSPLKDPVFPHVEYFFNPDSGIAWEHYIQFKDHDENAKLIDDNLEAAFKHFDIIICQALGYKWGLNRLIELKQKYNKVLLMEIDDCFDEFTPSNHSSHLLRDHFNVQARQAIISDAIITTNPYLGRKLSKYNQNIYILPNAIYKNLWEGEQIPIDKTKEDYVDYAYVAGGGHDEDLKIIYKAMLPLMDEGIKFGIFYSSYKPDFIKEHKNLRYENWCHHIGSFYKNLLKVNCNMFLAPLRDTEFNRCKSDIKIQEAHMCGKQIICSNVGPYKNHKKSYLVENDTKKWISILKRNKDNSPRVKLNDRHKVETYAEDFLIYLHGLLMHKVNN